MAVFRKLRTLHPSLAMCAPTLVHTHTTCHAPFPPSKHPYLCKVTLVHVQLLIVQVDDVRGNCVEEVTVVRHHHQRLLPASQVLLKPQH